jgi:hypothetical protein
VTALILLIALASHRPLQRLLAARLDSQKLRFLNVAAPFFAPCIVVAAIAVSPTSGDGVFGFLGLLKRAELELAYLLWAIVPVAAATVCFAFIGKKEPVALTAFVVCLAGPGSGPSIR